MKISECENFWHFWLAESTYIFMVLKIVNKLSVNLVWFVEGHEGSDWFISKFHNLINLETQGIMSESDSW